MAFKYNANKWGIEKSVKRDICCMKQYLIQLQSIGVAWASEKMIKQIVPQSLSDILWTCRGV